jgi:CRP/FNR family cyclic AMP-dependent transcriptional regulator
MTDPLFARFGREFQPGEVLFREDERGDVMYVIQAGAVRITKQVAGTDKTLAVLGPGEFLGEMAILNGKPRTATAVVLEPTRCLEIEARTLESMIAKNAEIAIRLVKKLAKRLDSADTLIEILMHRDPRARFILGLSRHADAFGEPTEGGVRIRATAYEIANEVGASLAECDEVMGRLVRLRLVWLEGTRGGLEGIDRRPVVVADVARLHDFADFLCVPERFGVEPSVPPGPPDARPSSPVLSVSVASASAPSASSAGATAPGGSAQRVAGSGRGGVEG